MGEKIFNHWYTLKYSQEKIEVEFNLNKEKLIKKYIRMITIIIFLASCGPSIEISFLFNFYQKNNFLMIMSVSYVVNFMYFIMAITTFISKNLKILKIIIYLDYYFMVFIFINTRYPLYHFLNYDIIIFYLFICVELILRVLWMMCGVNTFLEFLTLNVLSIISTWVFYAPVGDPNTPQKNTIVLSVYSFSFIIVTLFSYLIKRHQKNAYFFQYRAEKKVQRLDNVLDNMKTGILSIKGEKITYINNYLEKLLDLWIDNSKKLDPLQNGKKI
jgi:hypothetical protein